MGAEGGRVGASHTVEPLYSNYLGVEFKVSIRSKVYGSAHREVALSVSGSIIDCVSPDPAHHNAEWLQSSWVTKLPAVIVVISSDLGKAFSFRPPILTSSAMLVWLPSRKS